MRHHLGSRWAIVILGFPSSISLGLFNTTLFSEGRVRMGLKRAIYICNGKLPIGTSESPVSMSVCRPSVNHSLKITSPKPLGGISPNFTGINLCGSLFKLFKYFQSMQNSGCHGNQNEKLKKSSCQKVPDWFKNNFAQKALWTLYQDCSNYIDPLKNMAVRGHCQFFLC